MAAFDGAAFDPAAFDAGASGPSIVGTGSASVGLEISVVDPLVFDGGQFYVRWAVTVMIGALDVSTQLTGRISISGAEDSARVATFSLIPGSPAEYAAYEGQPVTIDITLFRTGQSATYRRFTGKVENKEFDPVSRVETLNCRDGWQERPRACTSAAEVEALFGGRAVACPDVLAWSDAEPDPQGYFSGLLETMIGATAIDSNGLWQAFSWDIGTPLATFTAADYFDGSIRLVSPNRSNMPKSVNVSLVHRYHRLHSAELDMSWEAVGRERYVIDGLPTLPKSTIQAAIEGITDWHVKGSVTITEPIPGTYPVIVGPQTVYYVVTYEQAPLTCQTMAAKMYRRWYQDIQVTYAASIPMGGTSDREINVTARMLSDFDASAWETSRKTLPSTALYSANEPTVVTPPTGYEGLPEPWPPTNSTLEYYGSSVLADIETAVNFVMSKGLRQAAAGRRDQRIKFSRPIDPRWEMGDVLAISGDGLSGTGQLIDFTDELDLDTGEVSSDLTLAVPDGFGSVTGFTASITPPVNSVTYAWPPLVLGTVVGAAFETAATPVEDDLVGFLCNALPTGNNYDATKPVFEPQFRIIMPSIDASYRDPVELTFPITAAVTMANGNLGIAFA